MISVMPIATVRVAEIDKVFSEVMGSEDAPLGVNTISLMLTVHPMMLTTLVCEDDHRRWRARKNPAMCRVYEGCEGSVHVKSQGRGWRRREDLLVILDVALKERW